MRGESKLEPCNHTKLMNYIIGMCKNHEDWICVLKNLGYTPTIIEQRFRTTSGDTVKPDIIVTSNKLVHSIVFECKGGITVDPDQLRRYNTLTEEDLRWVDVFSFDDFHFDVCIVDIQKNHLTILSHVDNKFPMITFGDEEVFKTGEFDEKKLEKVFQNPISVKGKVPPLYYYPFCEEDENAYIIPFIMRGLVSIAIKKAKGGSSVFDNELITKDEIIELVFNPVFKTLSKKQQGHLKKKITDIMHLLLSMEETKDALGLIEGRKGYKISNQLEKLRTEADKLIKKYETQQFLTDMLF